MNEDKNSSFLPLDADGFCVNHPDVQLAKMSKNGDWKVLLDFCPECAGDSLMIGGNPAGGGGGNKKSSSKRRESYASHGRSRSDRSNGNMGGGSDSPITTTKIEGGDGKSMFVEKMPFVDEGGKVGHYTGHVNIEGKPHGEGKMRYVNGKVFDGSWEKGRKVHGRMSGAKKSSSTRKSQSSNRDDVEPAGAAPSSSSRRRARSSKPTSRISEISEEHQDVVTSRPTKSKSFYQEPEPAPMRPIKIKSKSFYEAEPSSRSHARSKSRSRHRGSEAFGL
jgi:hypothetical protein